MKKIEIEINLGKALRDVQEITVGLFVVGKSVELIVDWREKSEVFETLHISNIAESSRTFYDTLEPMKGDIYLFEKTSKYKTLSEFLNNPIEWNDWFLKHIVKLL